VNPRFLDWIWHIKGSLALPPGQSSDEAFGKLDPLFRQTGTTHHLTKDTLTFRKKGQAPQDKMSIFDDGVLRIERGAAGLVLHYHLTSKALLFCFLAPLLFLGFAQLTVVVGNLQQSETEAKLESEEKEEAQLPLHPLDQALGAPAPEKPKEDGEEKSEDDDKPSPTPAYVFAALFAALYLVGRVLEDRLVRRLFRKRLTGPEPSVSGAYST
jgi:hypothetical protein